MSSLTRSFGEWISSPNFFGLDPIPTSVALPVPSGEGPPLVPGDDIILDNASATFTAGWTTGTISMDKYGADYRFAHTSDTVTQTATYIPVIPQAGRYDVYVWYPQGSNRSTHAPHLISSWDGTVTVNANQQANGGGWRLLAAERIFAPGTNGFVRLSSNTGEPAKVVLADAVRFVFATNQEMPRQFTSVGLSPVQQRILFIVNDIIGTTNLIETSTDLVNWSAFASIVMTNSAMPFSDAVTNGPVRFYRTKPAH
jgi:hypothetical protein